MEPVAWRSASAQDAARRRLAMQRERGGGIGLVGEAAGVLEHAFAELGQHLPARASLQQAFAERVLQPGEPARQRRLRQPGALGRAREAAGIGNLREQDQVVGVELHRKADCSETGILSTI